MFTEEISCNEGLFLCSGALSKARYRGHISIFQTTTVFDALSSVVIVSRGRLVRKAGELQRNMSLLRFLLDHVTLTVCMKF